MSHFDRRAAVSAMYASSIAIKEPITIRRTKVGREAVLKLTLIKRKMKNFKPGMGLQHIHLKNFGKQQN